MTTEGLVTCCEVVEELGPEPYSLSLAIAPQMLRWNVLAFMVWTTGAPESRGGPPLSRHE